MALALEARGSGRYLPRWRGGAEQEELARALCMLVNDSDRARAEARWREFLPARGSIEICSEIDDDFAEEDNRHSHSSRKTTRERATLADLGALYGDGEAPGCVGEDCQAGNDRDSTTVTFGLRGGRRYVVRVHRYHHERCSCRATVDGLAEAVDSRAICHGRHA